MDIEHIIRRTAQGVCNSFPSGSIMGKWQNDTRKSRKFSKWIPSFKWNDAWTSSFFIEPSRKLRVPITEFEYDKKARWSLRKHRLFMLLQTANCKTCYYEVTCFMLVFAKIRSRRAAFLSRSRNRESRESSQLCSVREPRQ